MVWLAVRDPACAAEVLSSKLGVPVPWVRASWTHLVWLRHGVSFPSSGAFVSPERGRPFLQKCSTLCRFLRCPRSSADSYPRLKCHFNYCPLKWAFLPTPPPRSTAWLASIKSLSLRCDWLASVQVRPLIVYGQESYCAQQWLNVTRHLLSKFLGFPIRQVRIENAPTSQGFYGINRMMQICVCVHAYIYTLSIYTQYIYTIYTQYIYIYIRTHTIYIYILH